MKIEDALEPGISTDTFFMECVPELFKARQQIFQQSSDTDVIVSVYFKDTDARYTCEFRADGCAVERDDMVDFPVATIVGEEADWEDFKRHMLAILLPLEQRANDYRERAASTMSRLTPEFLAKLERFDGVFERSEERRVGKEGRSGGWADVGERHAGATAVDSRLCSTH